jgi:hypothetical protein
VQENGSFTLEIQLTDRQMRHACARGVDTASSFEKASDMIAGVAAQFGISEPAISITIVMENFKAGTRH